MKEKKSINIQILGRNYTLKSDADEKYVTKIGTYVNSKIEEITKLTKTVDTLNIAILSLLNIADEFFQFKESDKSIVQKVEGKSESLIKLIDSTL